MFLSVKSTKPKALKTNKQTNKPKRVAKKTERPKRSIPLKLRIVLICLWSLILNLVSLSWITGAAYVRHTQIPAEEHAGATDI